MFKRLVLFLFILLILGGVFFLYDLNTPRSSSGKEVSFKITKGQGTQTIAQNLQKANLIRSAFNFALYARFKNSTGLQAGDYLLSQKMSGEQIFDVISGGKVTSNNIIVRFIEGTTVADMADVWADTHKDNPKAAAEFNAAATLAAKSFGFFGEKPTVVSLEGYLFPDTYFVAKDAGPDVAINKMLDTMDLKLSEKLRSEIKVQGKSIYEILTLASIVEKEVGRNTAGLSQADIDKLDVERKTVAGIFWNRIEQGIALQSDATVTYITKKKDPSPTYDDTKINSPYNTYKNRGLPPGPISNPSLASIIAVVEPIKTDYLYFISKPDGTAVYAKTYEEHLANKNKYLK